MILSSLNKSSRGQTAVEYLLLLAVVAVVVFGGLKLFIPAVRENSEQYYNQVTRVIKGENPTPINGGWCPAYCPDPNACGPAAVSFVCACPVPAFGGAYCAGASFKVCPRGSLCQSACDASMKAACDNKDPSCTCLAPDPPSCGGVSHGINLCNQECTKPSDPSQVIPCVSACPSPEPQGTDCPNTRVQIPATATWTVVANQGACQAGKCRKYCLDATTMPDPTGTQCVPLYCQGAIPNAHLCPGREPNSSNVQASLVSSCTVDGGNGCPGILVNGVCTVSGRMGTAGGECEYVCDPEYHASTTTCLANCTGSLGGNPKCAGTDINKSSTETWHAVENCSSASQCAYLSCPPGKHSDGTHCVCDTPLVPGCTDS